MGMFMMRCSRRLGRDDTQLRILAVDFGQKRIGLAHCESDLGLPISLPNLLASGTLKKDAEAIVKVATEVQAELILVGFPNHDNPSDGGKMQRACRAVATLIEQLGFRVELIDEAFSSETAIETLKSIQKSTSTIAKLKDGAAACVILERYLDTCEAKP